MYQFLNCFDSVIFPSFLRFHPVLYFFRYLTVQNCCIAVEEHVTVRGGMGLRQLSRDGCITGLPDGIFPYQNLQFWFVLRGLGMENFEMVYLLFLVYFWYIFKIPK